MAIQSLHSVAPKQPGDWAGSKHPKYRILFEKHPIKTATGDALRGLHSMHSTLENPIGLAAWNYVDAPKVSILIPKVRIEESNPYKLPAGEYLLVNRQNRAPVRDKWKVDYTYEFPGRAYRASYEEIKDPDEAARVTAREEFGMNNASVKKLATNVTASAGNSSLVYDFYGVELKPENIDALVQEFGAELDTETGVVRIDRKCDAGIVDGIELVPAASAQQYFKTRESQNQAIAATTYAGLNLIQAA